jgi:hypothetical protein
MTTMYFCTAPHLEPGQHERECTGSITARKTFMKVGSRDASGRGGHPNSAHACLRVSVPCASKNAS